MPAPVTVELREGDVERLLGVALENQEVTDCSRDSDFG